MTRDPLEPNEALIQAAVMAHWRVFGRPGTLMFAVPNAKAHGQAGLTKGVFDLGVIGPFGRMTAWLELKRQGRQREKNGGLSDDQVKFRDILVAQDIPHAVTYGRDEPIAVLEAWGVLRER